MDKGQEAFLKDPSFETERASKKRKKKKQGALCFNADCCCAFYKPRLIFVKLIVVFLIFLPTIFWIIQYCLFFLIDIKLLTNNELYIFAIGNPFLVLKEENGSDEDRINNVSSIKYMLLNYL